jgi:hypothetical protein
MTQRVGWVERSDTHHLSTIAMGIATLNPSYDFWPPFALSLSKGLAFRRKWFDRLTTNGFLDYRVCE